MINFTFKVIWKVESYKRRKIAVIFIQIDMIVENLSDRIYVAGIIL